MLLALYVVLRLAQDPERGRETLFTLQVLRSNTKPSSRVFHYLTKGV